MKNNSDNNNRAQILLLLGIAFVALNLRPALASVGPLVGVIRDETGLSNSMLGLLTSLPLLAFGFVSMFTPLFTRRFGVAGTLAGALAVLAIGLVVRSLPSVPALFLGTALLGVAIALGNVLIPGLVKRKFPHKSGQVTSLYSGFLGVGAATAAGISLPLSEVLPFEWRGALGIWAFLAIVTFFIWLPQLRYLKPSENNRSFKQAMNNLRRSKLAWRIALFMGLQSMGFYVILAWLPEILHSRGYDSTYAGWMLSLSQATGILGSLIMPTVAGWKKSQKRSVWFLIILECISIIGFMLPQIGLVALWSSTIGFALGGTFGLALLFIVLRSDDSDTATELSGVAQSIGYFIAATGPILIGSIFDLTQTWMIPLALLFVIAFLKLYMGLGAAANRKLEFETHQQSKD